MRAIKNLFVEWRQISEAWVDFPPPGRQDVAPFSKKKTLLTHWMNTLLEDYQHRIYFIDISVAENWGAIQGQAEKSGKPMASLDSLIAAVAYTHNLILVTRNTRDFEASKIETLNPWRI